MFEIETCKFLKKFVLNFSFRLFSIIFLFEAADNMFSTISVKFAAVLRKIKLQDGEQDGRHVVKRLWLYQQFLIKT